MFSRMIQTTTSCIKIGGRMTRMLPIRVQGTEKFLFFFFFFFLPNHRIIIIKLKITTFLQNYSCLISEYLFALSVISENNLEECEV